MEQRDLRRFQSYIIAKYEIKDDSLTLWAPLSFEIEEAYEKMAY